MIEATDGQSRISRIGEMVAFLRDNPDSRFAPNELAEKFGFEEEFVGRVVSDLRDNPISGKDRLSRGPNVFTRLASGLRTLLDSYPFLFAVLSVGFYAGLEALAETFGIRVQNSVVLGSLSLLLLFQGYLYFRNGQPALPFKVGAIFLLPAAARILEGLRLQMPSVSLWLVIVLAGFLSLIGCFIYAGVFSMISAWGGLSAAKNRERTATRNELLVRYFEITDRLKVANGDRRDSAFLRFVAAFRRRAIQWAFLCGLIYAAFFVALQLGFRINFAQMQKGVAAVPPIYLLLLFVLSSLGLACFVGLAFFAGSAKRAALANLAYELPQTLANYFFSQAGFTSAVAYQNSGHRIEYRLTGLASIVAGLALNAGLAAFCGAAAQLRERKVRDRLILENDEPTLVSELFRLQSRLAEQPVHVCVAAVDVVRSTAMKESADPLAAEFSFRRYQEWIAQISSGYRGRVEATAGDGAIVAFPSADEAVQASRAIQEDLPRFNRSDNKLSTPFCLRIGIHLGDVAASISEVQFTRVIDVAAHVEKVAPVGGIAFTHAVAAEIESGGIQDLEISVDGYPLYTVSPLHKGISKA